MKKMKKQKQKSVKGGCVQFTKDIVYCSAPDYCAFGPGR